MDKKMQKRLLISLGALSLTKKKAAKLASSLVNTGLLAKPQARVLAGKVAAEIKKVNVKLNGMVIAEVMKQVAKAKPAIKKFSRKAGIEGKIVAKDLAAKAEKIAKQIGKSLK